MTLQELSRFFKLKKRLERNEQILASLEASAYPGAQALSGMPHSPGIKDRVGDLAVEIADVKERVRYLRGEFVQEEKIVAELIDTADDEQMRTILRLRFLRCLTWGEVAAVIGGRNTENGVKASFYRYLALTSCNDVSRDDT